mmetsp:Transcript_51139/g.101593  ORF Transcript_51139/g.101593 Transcript_51139/m.101593 type:complete len:201 (+) Transcript_51139:710-1312(+)
MSKKNFPMAKLTRTLAKTFSRAKSTARFSGNLWCQCTRLPWMSCGAATFLSKRRRRVLGDPLGQTGALQSWEWMALRLQDALFAMTPASLVRTCFWNSGTVQAAWLQGRHMTKWSNSRTFPKPQDMQLTVSPPCAPILRLSSQRVMQVTALPRCVPILLLSSLLAMRAMALPQCAPIPHLSNRQAMLVMVLLPCAHIPRP